MADSTTVRIDLETRERLRRAEERLGVSTGEAIRQAMDALDAKHFWDDVEQYYEANPELPDEDREWIEQAMRAQG